ncbi:exonuclease [Pseudomonas phage MiCath]|uniref:Exonuclease n=1 Tax=Pseudomonas phage MiCath TaxID=3003729 RepID=A0AAE9VDY5_9CAUD|nr:exonuclease [Pseudomonas phage MiCath]WAX22415.1 exonuclease [Pseudomonas phage MiCath]
MKDSDKVCTYCGATGHTANRCPWGAKALPIVAYPSLPHHNGKRG